VKNIKMKLPGKSNSLIAVILVSIAILFSGCTIKVPMAPNVGRLEIYNKYPVEAGLLITKETKNYIFKGNPESFTARYCQMLCTALGSDPVYFDTVNKLYSFNYHC
jgi:hypothetical protein